MKKLFSVFVILTAILLLFTGCDDILNAAYPAYDPESDEGGWIGDKRIEVHIDIDDSGDINVSSKPVQVALVRMWENSYGGYDPDYDSLIVKEIWVDSYGDPMVDMSFDWLSNNAYMLFAWYDLEHNGRPDYDEPAIQLTWWNDWNWEYEDLFDFRWDDDLYDYYGTGWLNDDVRLSPDIVEEFAAAFNAYDDTVTYYDASFWIDGPSFINPDDAYSERYTINPNSMDIQYLESFYWQLLDQNRNQITEGYSFGDVSNWYSNNFDVDYSNSVIQDYFYYNNPSELVLQVTAWFENPDDAYSTLPWQSELVIGLDDFDPGFWLEGMDVLTRDSHSELTYYDIYTNSSEGIASLRWRIADDYWNPIYYSETGYAPYYEWTYDNDTDPYVIEVTFDNLDTPLSSDYWSYMPGLFIEVEITYDNNTVWTQNMWIELVDADSGGTGGGWYNLITNMNLGASYAGYHVDLYFYNVDDGGGEYYYDYAGVTLDTNGYATFIRWNYEDPADYDQKVYAYLYTPDWYSDGGTEYTVYYSDYEYDGYHTVDLNDGSFMY